MDVCKDSEFGFNIELYKLFSVVLVIIVKRGRRFRGLLVNGWIYKDWYSYIVEFYLVRKRDEALIYVITCVSFEKVMYK